MTQTTSPTGTLTLWRKLEHRPLGRRLFSVGLCLRAPYFATVLPSVRELRPGYSEVAAPKWWGVHNHIGTFHALAACNLAEAAMGVLAEATVPATHRWLPRGMTTSYLAKARTSLLAVAELEVIPEFGAESFDLPVPVTVYDREREPVVLATITIKVSPKKG